MKELILSSTNLSRKKVNFKDDEIIISTEYKMKAIWHEDTEMSITPKEINKIFDFLFGK